MYDELIAQKADFETVKTTLQNWYNKNNGIAIQQELSGILRGL
jgi:hypothetical protein